MKSNGILFFCSFTFVGDKRFRLIPHTVQRVGDVLILLADRLIKCVVGDVAMSRRPAPRVATDGDNDRPLRADGDDDETQRG